MADPIEAAYYAQMNALAEVLDETFNGTKRPRKLAFVLLTAEFDKIENGRVNYISNGTREDMIAMLKEWLARAEGRYAEPPEKSQ